MKENPKAFLQRVKWKFREASNGEQYEVGCPFTTCANQGQTQFYIKADTGAWFCHRCGEKGRSIRELETRLGIVKFLGEQLSTSISVSPEEIQELQDALTDNSKAMQYLVSTRGFSLSSIIQFRLGLKEVNGRSAIVLPYFDRHDTCVALKYYFYDSTDGVKCIFEKDSKPIFFNTSGTDFKGEVVLTEGEFDAISAWQYGYTNVISVPTGSESSGDYFQELGDAQKVFLVYDNDPAGQKGAIKASYLVGTSKSFRVHLPLKDFNECLQSGIDKKTIQGRFDKAQSLFKAPLFQASSFKDETQELLQNPVRHKGVSTGWRGVDEFIGGIREGEVTSFSGQTSSGKTTFSLALASNLMRQGTKVLVISPEMRESELVLEVINNYANKKIESASEADKYFPLIEESFYLAKVFNEWTTKKNESILERVFDIIEYSAKYKGVKFVILDHLRLFLDSKKSEDERFSIEAFIKTCVKAAISFNIHIWLVVQPRKTDSSLEEIEIYDLKGSSNIEQDSNNVVLIHKMNTVPGLVKLKFPKIRSTAGQMGETMLQFNLSSRANYIDVAKKVETHAVHTAK